MSSGTLNLTKIFLERRVLIPTFTISRAHAYLKSYPAIHPANHNVVYDSVADIACQPFDDTDKGN